MERTIRYTKKTQVGLFIIQISFHFCFCSLYCFSSVWITFLLFFLSYDVVGGQLMNSYIVRYTREERDLINGQSRPHVGTK
jgi:hypothetical protein